MNNTATKRKTATAPKKADAANVKAAKSAKKAIKRTVSSIVASTQTSAKEKPGNELQDTLKRFIADSLKSMMDSFEELSPTKQWELIVQLLPYATPKMASTDINANMDFDPLASQLGQLANDVADDEDESIGGGTSLDDLTS